MNPQATAYRSALDRILLDEFSCDPVPRETKPSQQTLSQPRPFLQAHKQFNTSQASVIYPSNPNYNLMYSPPVNSAFRSTGPPNVIVGPPPLIRATPYPPPMHSMPNLHPRPSLSSPVYASQSMTAMAMNMSSAQGRHQRPLSKHSRGHVAQPQAHPRQTSPINNSLTQPQEDYATAKSPASSTSTGKSTCRSTSPPLNIGLSFHLLDKKPPSPSSISPVKAKFTRTLELKFTEEKFNLLKRRVMQALEDEFGGDSSEPQNKLCRYSNSEAAGTSSHPLSGSLMPKESYSVQLLNDVKECADGSLIDVDIEQVNFVRQLVDACVCGDLKFPNPLRTQQNLSVTLREKNTEWDPVVNQLSIFTLPVIKFASAFFDSEFSQGRPLSLDDQNLLLQSRIHSCQSPLFTPVFSPRDYTMTVQVEGKYYLVATHRSTKDLINKLPSGCHAALKAEAYKVHLGSIAEKDLAVIGLYTLLKLTDIGTTGEGVPPADLAIRSRSQFLQVAQLLKRYLIHKFGREVGLNKFESLINLFEWAHPFDNSVRSVFQQVAVSTKGLL